MTSCTTSRGHGQHRTMSRTMLGGTGRLLFAEAYTRNSTASSYVRGHGQHRTKSRVQVESCVRRPASSRQVEEVAPAQHTPQKKRVNVGEAGHTVVKVRPIPKIGRRKGNPATGRHGERTQVHHGWYLEQSVQQQKQQQQQHFQQYPNFMRAKNDLMDTSYGQQDTPLSHFP